MARRNGLTRKLSALACPAVALVWAMFTVSTLVAQDDAADGDSAQDGVAAVQQAYQLSKTADSVEEYDEIIRLCNRGLNALNNEGNAAYTRKLLSWTHNRRGEMQADQGAAEEALADFDRAVQLDPERWQAWHNRGVSYAMQGRFEDAMSDLDQTIELRPEYANAWFNRGELHYEAGAFERAIEDYNQAIQLRPEDSAAYNSRGHAYYRLGDYRNAVENYTQAIRRDGTNAAAYTNRGDAYADVGQYAQAARDYRAAIRIDAQLGRAYQSAAWLMATCVDQQYRNAQLAVEAAQRAIELDGEDDYRYLDTLAAAFANAGQFDKAIELQERVLEAVPAEEADRYARRLTLYEEGQPYRDSLAADGGDQDEGTAAGAAPDRPRPLPQNARRP